MVLSLTTASSTIRPISGGMLGKYNAKLTEFDSRYEYVLGSSYETSSPPFHCRMQQVAHYRFLTRTTP